MSTIQGKYPGDGDYYVCDFCEARQEVLHVGLGHPVPDGWLAHVDPKGFKETLHICDHCVSSAIVRTLGKKE